jgi:MFS family permease
MTGSLSPLSHRLFAWLWVGNAVSALGTWIQSTASAWVMTDLAPDPLMVSLIQAASQLPVLLLALPAGALADIVDLRRYLVWTNIGMLAVSGALAVLYALGLVDAVVLIALTGLLACFSAMNSPAWAAAVPLTISRTDLPQALVLNSIGFNLARALGPAIGGAIVAAYGATLAFGINAVSFAIIAIIIGLPLAFSAHQQMADLPPEPIPQAIKTGLRYAVAEPNVRAALARSAAFYGCASAIWALLPLYVRDVLGYSSATYGIMLGAIGAGAVAGGIIMPALRERMQRDTLMLFAGILTSVSLVPIALVPTPVTTGLSLFAFGVGWIAGASNLQTTVQLACSPWVRARGLAIYQAVFNGSMGMGAIAWGWLGVHAGLPGTILAAGLGGLVIALLARSQQLPAEIVDPALGPVRELPSVAVDASMAPFLLSGHTVLVSITYTVDPSQASAFRAAMNNLRLARLRDGAVAWMLARNVEHADQWVETFRLPDWHELRRGMARVNLVDDEAARAVRVFHRDQSPPQARILLWDSP